MKVKIFDSFSPRDKKRFLYLPVKVKLVITQMMAFTWVFFSIYVARPWINDLARTFTLPVAWLIVAGIALIPGWANAFLIAGLSLDRRPGFNPDSSLPPVTLLIAAYNEENNIGGTLASVFSQNYRGELEVIVIDDGSVDNTASAAKQASDLLTPGSNCHFQLLVMPVNGGKSKALNQGLKKATHDIVVTIDADTHLYSESLTRLITNLIDGPANTAAVAGTVLVRNSRDSILSRLQEWDYFLGIAVVKRIQSLYQGTLVAQGAFSAYRKEAILEAGGWSERVGEDIVLTWAFLERGYRVGYAENAFAFTTVPESYRQFFRQRRRWARGLIEAFKCHPRVLFRPRLVTPFILFNFLFPFLDLIYLTVFIPGLVAAILFRYYAIVGLMTLLLIPLMVLVNVIMFYNQRRIFRLHGLRVRKNVSGAILYMMTYQTIMAPASFLGYLSEFFNLRRVWGTK